MTGLPGAVGRLVKGRIRRFALLLAGFGIVDAERSEETIDLALPRVTVGFSRMSQRTVDFIMVGIAVGPTGLAALTIVSPFWSVASGVGSGLTNGAIGFISQRYGTCFGVPGVAAWDAVRGL